MASSWSSLSSIDKQAFYSILDEYFESRPHLFQHQSTSTHGKDNFSALSNLASSNPNLTASALKSAGVSPSLAKPSNVSSASKHLNGIGSKVGQLSGKFNHQFSNSNSELPPPPPNRTPSSSSISLPNPQKFEASTASPKLSNQTPFAPPPIRRVMPPITPSHSQTPPRPTPPILKPTDEELVEAMYDYEGTSPEDLSFKQRQMIKVTEHISDDWWNGRIGNGPIGMFPSSYVKPI